MGRIGFGEVLIIGMIFVLLFGIKKLPEIGRSLGEAIREFKKSMQQTNETKDNNSDQKN